jgi:hypothetical protein
MVRPVLKKVNRPRQLKRNQISLIVADSSAFPNRRALIWCDNIRHRPLVESVPSVKYTLQEELTR